MKVFLFLVAVFTLSSSQTSAQQLSSEQQVVASCAALLPNIFASVGCVSTGLTANEFNKCLKGDCFGPNNDIRKAWESIISLGRKEDSTPTEQTVWRLYKGENDAHFYTTDCGEAQRAQRDFGYQIEGSAYAIPRDPGGDRNPFYRFWNGRVHFYTIDENAEGNTGFASGKEGILGYIYKEPGDKRVPLYRAYRDSTQKHLWSIDLKELAHAVQKDGYVLEGVSGWVSPNAGGKCS